MGINDNSCTILENFQEKERKMREIKFRAWHPDLFVMYFSEDESDFHEFLIDKQGVYCKSYDIEANKVNEITRNIMQYTGLKDRNGKEIYEGDIMNHKEWRENYYFVVFYNEFENCGCCDKVSGIGFDFGVSNIGEYKVVGNIYENPELLEKIDVS